MIKQEKMKMPAADLRDDERKAIDTAIDSAVARERERCAHIAEGYAEVVAGDTHEQLCHVIAASIRGA